MLLIKTKIAPSVISGIGLFANESIPKGAVVWKYVPEMDKALSKEAVEGFNEPARSFIKHFGHFSPELNCYILSFDNDRFTNHSEDPNTALDRNLLEHGEPSVIAIRDIAPGEEITIDYRDTDGEYRYKLQDPEDQFVPKQAIALKK